MDDNAEQREPHSLNGCCCRTPTAAKIVGWFDVILSIIVIVFCIVNFGGDYDVDILILISSHFLLLASVILLVGIGRKSAAACLPYIIYKALQVIVSVGLTIWLYVATERRYGVQPHIGAIWCTDILWEIYQLATATDCFVYFHGLGSQTGFALQQQYVSMQTPYGNAYEGYDQQHVGPMQIQYGNAYEGFAQPQVAHMQTPYDDAYEEFCENRDFIILSC